MKHLIVSLLLSCCLYISNLQAQDYVPFPDSNAYWRIDYATHYCYDTGIPDAQYQYVLTGDTIFNNLTYHKIERSGVCWGCCLPPLSSIALNGYIGAFRNDTIKKVVYILLSGSNEEILLYDFDLNVGDTLEGYHNNPPTSGICHDVVVTSIDSILIGADFRPRFQVQGPFCTSFIIEGIGSTTGLLEPLSSMEQTGVLVCFTQNQQTLFPDTLSPCELSTSIEDQYDTGVRISVFPNPCRDHFHIEYFSQSDDAMEINIHSLIGTPVESITAVQIYTGSNSLRINCSDYTPGVYFVNLRSSTFSKTVPFIKH